MYVYIHYIFILYNHTYLYVCTYIRLIFYIKYLHLYNACQALPICFYKDYKGSCPSPNPQIGTVFYFCASHTLFGHWKLLLLYHLSKFQV